jgi:hypothetical protein
MGAVTVFMSALFHFPAFVHYDVTGTELAIRMNTLGQTRTRSYALANIEDARRVRLHGGRRVAGTGLSNYCQGRFWYPDLGSVWQATSCGSDAVVLRIKDEKLPVVVTPLNPEAFLTAIKEGQPSGFGAPRFKESATLRAFAIFVPLLLLATTVLMPLAFIVFPSRLNYSIGDGRLAIDKFFRPKVVNLAGCRAIRLVPKSKLRYAGSSLPGYYSGFFRIDGQRTRVYATTLEEGVLVTELEGTRHFVSPQDTTAFLDSLRRNGATVEG